MRMRNLAVVLAIGSIAVTATLANASRRAGTGINGSLHDLNHISGYTPDALERSCVFCHTPHNAMTTDALVPLWNHENATPVTTPAYVWIAPTNKAIGTITDPLVGPTRLCMACHDGVTAVDSHGTAKSATGTKHPMQGVPSATYNDALGQPTKRYITDMKVTHPIGFKYEVAYNKRGPTELVPATKGFLTAKPNWDTWDTQRRNDDNGNSKITLTNKKIEDTLYDGYMTCATCHDVHNSVNALPDGDLDKYNYFLYAKEEGSAICLSCHVK